MEVPVSMVKLKPRLIRAFDELTWGKFCDAVMGLFRTQLGHNRLWTELRRFEKGLAYMSSIIVGFGNDRHKLLASSFKR